MAPWFTAVGMKYRGNYKFKSGVRVTLVPEDDNPHDSNAVKVLAENRHVAYVAREHTARVRRALKNPEGLEYSAVFDKYNSGRWGAYFNIVTSPSGK